MRAPAASLSCLLLCAVACSPAREEGGAPASDTNAPAGSPSAGAAEARPLPSPLPDVLARVNGRAVRLAQILPIAMMKLKRVPAAPQDERKARAVRQALEEYVERELLLQEALARGVSADARSVDWAYDQMRRAHPDDADWAKSLAAQGMDAQSLKAELRVQQTVAALLEKEAASRGVSPDEARTALLGALRARARIERFL
jgi:hypothetical protein